MEPNLENSAHIHITIHDSEGDRVYYRIKKTTKFELLLEDYCEQMCAAISAIRLVFEGNDLQPNQTPLDVGMECGNEIIAYRNDPEYASKGEALAHRDKLMKQLESVNTFISLIEQAEAEARRNA